MLQLGSAGQGHITPKKASKNKHTHVLRRTLCPYQTLELDGSEIPITMLFLLWNQNICCRL
jgi:hypothetical protein